MAAEKQLLHVPQLIADEACELALAAEAMRAYPRFLARGANPDAFTSPVCKLVLEACATVWEALGEVNLTCVATELQRTGKLARVGGLRGLAEIAGTSEAIPDHQRVHTLASLRRLKEAGQELVRAAHAGDLTRAVEVAQNAEQAAISTGRKKVRAAWEAVEDLRTSLRDEARSKALRIHPGLTAVHQAVGFIPVGSMVTIGADSNVGKSSFVLEMLLACAARNVRCGLVSVEDSDDVTAARILSTYSGVSSRSLQRGDLSPHDQAAIDHGFAQTKSMGDRLMLADCTGETELEVCAAMSEMAAKGAKLIAVDYLTEIEASKPKRERRNEVAWIAKRLKAHARRIGVVLVMVSQLARPSDKQTGKRPSKHDLKETGDLTNMSEVILLLWREEESDFAPVQIWASKVKWGGVGQSWTMQRDYRTGRLVENGPASRSA